MFLSPVTVRVGVYCWRFWTLFQELVKMNGRLLKNCRAVSKFLMKSDILYLPSTYCVTKFAYIVVPSIVVETVFL